MESFSKLDIIFIILKSANKGCENRELYSKLQSHLTMSQLMKFIFELKRYDLLESLRNECRYIITPKGMQYLQIHEELTNQIQLEITWKSGIFKRYIPFFKWTNLLKKRE